MTRVRVGVAGVGSLGQHHARLFAQQPLAELVAVHDRDQERAAEVAARHAARACASFEELLQVVDALSIAVPTVDHAALAARALSAGRHVLVEKPMTSTLAEADELVALAERHGRCLQVGHVERFNPAAQALWRHGRQARFVEVHRLSGFPARSLDVDVVLDVMIHDLDLVLALGAGEPTAVEAVGVPVLSDKVDIANARLRFASGLIANLTASRVSTEKLRKFRIFAQHTYVSADLLAREAQVYRLAADDQGRPTIAVERTQAGDVEPLERQLAAFVTCVSEGRPPLVSGHDGRRALALAQAVLTAMAAVPGATPA